MYIRAFPELGSRWQISVAGGTEPVWSPDGKELFYKQENKMIAATLETDLIVRVAKRAVLFEKNDFVFDPMMREAGNYDIHPNGDKFVMVKQIHDSDPELIVVLNWVEELKSLVTAGK